MVFDVNDSSSLKWQWSDFCYLFSQIFR